MREEYNTGAYHYARIFQLETRITSRGSRAVGAGRRAQLPGMPAYLVVALATCDGHTSGRNYEYMGSAIAGGARDWRNLLLYEKEIVWS